MIEYLEYIEISSADVKEIQIPMPWGHIRGQYKLHRAHSDLIPLSQVVLMFQDEKINFIYSRIVRFC